MAKEKATHYCKIFCLQQIQVFILYFLLDVKNDQMFEIVVQLCEEKKIKKGKKGKL